MDMDNITKQSLLYDFYGALLTKRQREVLQLYHEENYTLAEIADEFGISRQAVHDALKNGDRALSGYEAKLGLVDKLNTSMRTIEEIDKKLDIIIDMTEDQHLIKEIMEVRKIIDNLED